MKKFAMIISLLIFCINFCMAEIVQTAVQTPITTPQNISFENCSKIFPLTQERLFLLTLSALSANKFSISEIQTSSGYIIFTANKNKYLATIGNVDNNHSILKITPCNNVYYFPPGILINTFKYIDMNSNEVNNK